MGDPGMGSFSIWHWLIVLAVVLILFGGGGKIPKLMRDMGQGINALKKGLKEENKKKEGEDEDDPKAIDGEAAMDGTHERDKAANGWGRRSSACWRCRDDGEGRPSLLPGGTRWRSFASWGC